MNYKIERTIKQKKRRNRNMDQVRVPKGHHVLPPYPIDLSMTLVNRKDEEDFIYRSNGL
jgi:hypothetical protein